MKNLGIKISIYLNYFVFAILLNSVGIVIAKSLNVYGVSEVEASILEAFKDLPIAIVSFLVASFLPRFGYKRGMLVALAIVFLGLLGMYYGNSFDSAKLLFLTVGVSFALIKLSVYSLIGVITDSPEGHSSLMSSVEGFFMVGIACAYFLFPAFYSDTDVDAWLNVYPVLCVLVGASFVFLLFSQLNVPIETTGKNLKEDILNSAKLMALPLVLVFIFSAFFFVMIEQGIMTWLPRFNEKIFSFDEKLSVNMAAILAITLALGRFIAGWASKKVAWDKIIIVCSLIGVGILLSVLPQLQPQDNAVEFTSISQVPLLGFILPLIGLFIAPIYPLLNSTVLSHLPKSLHSPMSGLIIIFSALGGTLGSRIVGILFGKVGGENAFYFLIIPIVLLVITVVMIKRIINKQELSESINTGNA